MKKEKLSFLAAARSFFFQNYPERSAFARFGIFYKDLAFVKLFDDALRQAEAQSPAAFFGGKPWFKYLVDVLRGDALARIGYIYIYIVGVFPDVYCDRSPAFH